jgi:hypothetical protein
MHPKTVGLRHKPCLSLASNWQSSALQSSPRVQPLFNRAAMAFVVITPTRVHLTRLLALWRSAGWPCHDTIELDLVAAGWVTLAEDGPGRRSVQLTMAGIQLLAASRQQHQRAQSEHDRLAARMAMQLCRAGRLVWRELSLRAHVVSRPHHTSALPPQQPLPLSDTSAPDELSTQLPPGHWRMARPDVFSVRRTTVQAYLHPVVHEIKVSRADLLSDLRNDSKRAAYQWLSCETNYVMPATIATLSDIPEPFGVWWLHGDVDGGTLEQVRPPQHHPCSLPLAVWMAMAQATPFEPSPWDNDAQPQTQLGAETGAHKGAP